MLLIYIILIAITVWFIEMISLTVNKKEHFNEQVGKFCTECHDKSLNQCLSCFNCVFAIDKFGNSACIGGDVKSGPYNNEDVAYWYSGDPWTMMKYNNSHYKCSYGPMQANRVIGV